MDQRVPILVYHHVYPEGHADLESPIRDRAIGVIGESDFRRQMAHIGDNGWTAISTTRLVEWLKPTFPRSAAWVRRNPVRVLPI